MGYKSENLWNSNFNKDLNVSFVSNCPKSEVLSVAFFLAILFFTTKMNNTTLKIIIIALFN